MTAGRDGPAPSQSHVGSGRFSVPDDQLLRGLQETDWWTSSRHRTAGRRSYCRNRQPTLVARGTADQVVDPGNAGVLTDLFPSARVELFDEAGASVPLGQPKRFARVVAGFLTDSAMPACESTSTVPRAG